MSEEEIILDENDMLDMLDVDASEGDQDDDFALESDPGDLIERPKDEQKDEQNDALTKEFDMMAMEQSQDAEEPVNLTLDSDSEDIAQEAPPKRAKKEPTLKPEEPEEKEAQAKREPKDEFLEDDNDFLLTEKIKPEESQSQAGIDDVTAKLAESTFADFDDMGTMDTPALNQEDEDDQENNISISTLKEQSKRERKNKRRERAKRKHTPEQELDYDMSDEEEKPPKQKNKKSKENTKKKDQQKKTKGEKTSTKKPAVKEAKPEPALVNMPNHPRKPQSGYQIFASENRALVVKEIEEKGEKASPTVVMKELGARWKALGDDKATYQSIAAADKKRYTLELEIYKETDEYIRACEIGGGGKYGKGPGGKSSPTKRGGKSSPVKPAVQPVIVRKVVKNTVLACNDYLEKFDISIIPNSKDRERVLSYYSKLAPLRNATSSQELTRGLLRTMERKLVSKLERLTSRINAHNKQVAASQESNKADLSQNTDSQQPTENTQPDANSKEEADKLKAVISLMKPSQPKGTPAKTPRKSYSATLNEETSIGINDGLNLSCKFEIDIED